MHQHPTPLPVHLIQPHGDALLRPHAVVEQEQRQRVIAAACRTRAVTAGEQLLELLLAERPWHLLLDPRQRHAGEYVPPLRLEVVRPLAPREERLQRAVVMVLVGGTGAVLAAAAALPPAHISEEGVDMRDFLVCDGVRKAEPAADAPEVCRDSL